MHKYFQVLFPLNTTAQGSSKFTKAHTKNHS